MVDSKLMGDIRSELLSPDRRLSAIHAKARTVAQKMEQDAASASKTFTAELATP
ncbi:hypothetical protein [Pseudothauera nasutitermitis]|uniref:hypothetical protein n=1 Tax=Pseudothauera nasutitermitis TaxID=2565930 RepID=UPI001454D4D2|nr:hypothetical protein [Pseudothauera nasutitermitis]